MTTENNEKIEEIASDSQTVTDKKIDLPPTQSIDYSVIKRKHRKRKRSEGIWKKIKKNKHFSRVISVLAFIAFVFLVYLYFANKAIKDETKGLIRNNINSFPHTEALILIDIEKFDKIPEETILDFYNSKRIKKILFLGNGKNISLYKNLRVKLLKMDVKPEDIFQDVASGSLYKAVFRSQYVYRVSSGVIMTTNNEIERAVFFSNQYGIRTFGYPVKNKLLDISFIKEPIIRGIDFLKHTFYAYPSEEDEELPIPITGNGKYTWEERGYDPIFEE
ncbi:MAG: hypothetical protein JXA60_00085 [Candidatus Coatesbacteria bacterium]|nr:hypothetical protein [Candidatus Coatesbacteria bacterium]